MPEAVLLRGTSLQLSNGIYISHVPIRDTLTLLALTGSHVVTSLGNCENRALCVHPGDSGEVESPHFR